MIADQIALKRTSEIAVKVGGEAAVQRAVEILGKVGRVSAPYGGEVETANQQITDDDSRYERPLTHFSRIDGSVVTISTQTAS